MRSFIKVGMVTALLGLGACGGESLETEPGQDTPGSTGSPLTVYQDLGQRTGYRVMNTITCGAPNQVTPWCSSSSTASERLYSWTAPTGGTYRINTTGSGFNTVLAIYDQWGNPLSACNDDANGTLQSEVLVTPGYMQKIIISVDGNGSSCGYFEINIHPV
ncbi:hypothetical protein ATI61_109362 [Archangium gephyra]|uniref:Lipoprotein n=1 Tax=Archangium gephyra TaxID=48 RepID=A0AAC8Q232_9BACT|nr:hypothetical protein [Archangium gephyra]AKI99435.1 Hypothetical protein AA314_01062 [Archangium gephyra]REG28018.1 hypothetical protein ATI61_109362 [Archangium gephyra]